MTADPQANAVTRKTVGNGIRVICEQIPTVRSVAAGVWCSAGVVDEPPPLNGVSHLIEHMFFKGTKRRTAAQLSAEIDGVGGALDAFTEKESVSFFAHGLLNATFPPQEFAKEKNVIAEEIHLYEDSPGDKIHDLIMGLVLPGEAISMPILGSLETVAAISREDAAAYRDETFTADRVVVGAAGFLEPDDFIARVEDYFGAVPGPCRRAARPAEPPPTPEAAYPKDTEQTHLCFGFPALPYGHPDRYALAALTTVLGGNASSRLFQRVREDRGLAYSVYAYGRGFHHTGALVAYAGTSPATALETRDLIREQFRELATNGIDAEELGRTREYLKGTLMLSLESTAARMGRNVRHEIYMGRYVSLEETLAGVEAVTTDDVLRLARDILSGEPAIVAIGPNAEAVVDV
jgi:predicted Zn-dependent peptidase